MSTPSSDDETDETDACPICLDLVRHNDTSAHFLCCRKPMCVSCAPIYLQSKFGRHCPLCREELPTTQKEMFEAHLKHARRGHLWAQFNLGVQHANGLGTAKSLPKAALWWQIAARQGHKDSQMNLGVLCAKGIGGMERSDFEAIRWWSLAAAQNDCKAQYSLGYFYLHGRGVPKSLERANHYWEKSAEKGNVVAIFGLGLLHMRGSASLLAESKVVERAADLGHANARLWCDVMSKRSMRWYEQAKFWCSKAAESGDLKARLEMEKLDCLSKASTSDITEAFLETLTMTGAVEQAPKIVTLVGEYAT